MLDLIFSAVKVIVLLGFLITIHELGHFIVAKLCNVKVKKFAIGFGKIIFKKQGKETEYSLRLIPLGGFVSMEGEEGDSEDERSFSKVNVWKRMAIVLAGAIVNIIFALLIYFILIFSSGTYVSNEVKEVISESALETIGVEEGDKIVELDNNTISSKSDIDEFMENSSGEEILIKIEKAESNTIQEYMITPKAIKNISTGIYLDQEGTIVIVDEDSAADRSGILANDKFVSINGINVENSTEKALNVLLDENVVKENEMIQIVVKRDETEVNISLQPEYVYIYQIGAQFDYAEDNIINRAIYGVMETKVFVGSIIENLISLFTGNVGIEQMMGPVGISTVIAKTDGFREFFEMMSLISLSLGITNLLPIPALDGGKMIFLITEAIRKKPVDPSIEVKFQLIGFMLLIGLSIYITFNDIFRIF